MLWGGAPANHEVSAMKEILGVMMGGGLGALLRFGLCSWTKRCLAPGLPWGTLAVNVLGGFLIGFIATCPTLGLHRHPALRTTLIAGCLGGFTTFSAFSLETFQLASAGSHGHAALNAVANVALALLATWLGTRVALVW